MDDKDGIVFVNTYEIKEINPQHPEKPDGPQKPEKPQTQTGDSTTVGLLIALMALAGSGIFVLRRKSN